MMETEYNNPVNLSMYRELDGLQHLQASVIYVCVCVCMRAWTYTRNNIYAYVYSINNVEPI